MSLRVGCLQTGRSVIRYGLARHSRGSFEETKSWLRKLIRRKVLSESNATEYKAIVEKLGILHDKSKVVYTLLILYFGSEI